MGVHLGRTIAVFTDQIESFEITETFEQFHDLLFIEVCRQAADENLVNRVGHIGRNHAWYVNAWRSGHVDASVVLGTTNFEGSIDEYDAVECHSRSGILSASELYSR